MPRRGNVVLPSDIRAIHAGQVPATVHHARYHRAICRGDTVRRENVADGTAAIAGAVHRGVHAGRDRAEGRDRLESCEPGVLKNKVNCPLYLLCFAVGNKRGKDIATRIADHLLKGVR